MDGLELYFDDLQQNYKEMSGFVEEEDDEDEC